MLSNLLYLCELRTAQLLCAILYAMVHTVCNSLFGMFAGWIPGRNDAKALLGLLTSSWLNLMLLVVPVGWICHFCHVNSIVVFVLVSPLLSLSHLSCPLVADIGVWGYWICNMMIWDNGMGLKIWD